MSNEQNTLRRRTVIGALAAASLTAPTRARAAKPPLPKSPVALSVMDVGGALALLQPAFEAYRTAYPERVSRITFVKAPAPELGAKIKAQVDAGRSDIDLVLSGSDGLAAGLALDLWRKILPDFKDAFGDLESDYEPAALNLNRAQGAGYGVVVNYYPSGPLLEYAPDRVAQVPDTAQGLLDWARAHPKRFMYARPSNSGPGRSFMMGLPYILGDSAPADPVGGWDKTWSYLQELGKYVEYYPAGTGATMKEFGEGSRDIIISTTGWDINPRALGIVPKEAKIGTLKGFHWVSDAFFMCVPRGIPDDRMAVVLDLMAFLLTPAMQAISYDEGYLYPGPAIRNVPISLAPKHSQEVIAEFGRPEYAPLIANNPIELPLKPDQMVTAFRMWDQKVGSKG
jgi:putative spermidine/putrescine transport system substrate-binding protein